MPLRPGRTVRHVERPYTRVSKKVPRKSYVVGVPFPKTHQFEMGSKDGAFETICYLVSEDDAQIRDNAIEAARVVAHKFLESTIGPLNYFMKILVYPHHVLREKPIATGAGADRYSQGMAQAFGKPVGTATQAKKGQKLVMVAVNKKNLDTAKQALKKFSSKISVRTRIIVSE
jgi:large subunit ribosomal protein L10e